MKARTLIDTKDSGYAAHDAADYATHNCTDGACRSFTISRIPLDTSRDTLGLGRNGEEDRDSNSYGSDNSLSGGW